MSTISILVNNVVCTAVLFFLVTTFACVCVCTENSREDKKFTLIVMNNQTDHDKMDTNSGDEIIMM